MNIGNSNWDNWNFEPTKMKCFTLFQFLTRLLTSKYLKLFSTYLVERNGTMWKTCVLAPQNAKKTSWNINTKCVTEFYWQISLRVWRIILVITGWAHKNQKFTLISIKIIRIWIFFSRNRIFKQKKAVSNLHVCSNGLGKMWASYIFHFSTRILTYTHTKNLIFFCIIDVAMSNNLFSALDNIKMTCQTHKC